MQLKKARRAIDTMLIARVQLLYIQDSQRQRQTLWSLATMD